MVLSRLTKITGPGVATDTNWVGNNADFTGITTTATSFNIGVTTIHSNLIEAHNIKSTGIITATGGSFSGNVTAVDGTFSGNVSIAGTLTYEDVTNIDAVGIITAPALDVDDFLDVGSNIKLGNAGVITATSFVGDGSGLIGVASTDNIVTGTAATFTGGVDINSDLDVDGHTNLDNVSIAGVVTATSFVGSGANLTSLPIGGSNAISLNDNVNLNIGTGNDGSLFNTGSYLFLKNHNGNVAIQASGTGNVISLQKYDNSDIGLQYVVDGSIKAYYNNSLKFTTETSGVNITGVCTATSFSGDGSNLTSLPAQATIANNADNRIITGGSGVNLNGESLLTFDGNVLLVASNSYNILEMRADENNDGGNDDNILKFTHDGTFRAEMRYDQSSSTLELSTSDNRGDLVIDTSGKVSVGGTFEVGHHQPADGSSAAKAAKSALEIKKHYPQKTSGNYWIIDRNGTAREIYCEMETDGGGWMLWHDHNAPGSKVSMNIALGGSDASPSGNLARSNYNNYAYYSVWIKASQIDATGERLHSFVTLDGDGEIKYIADYGSDFLLENVGDEYQPNRNDYFASNTTGEYVSNTQMYSPQCGASGWQSFSNGGWSEVYIREMDTRISPGDHRSLHLVERIYNFDSNGVPFWIVAESMHPTPHWSDISLIQGEAADGNNPNIQTHNVEINSMNGNNGPSIRARSRGVLTGTFEYTFQLGYNWGWSIACLNATIGIENAIKNQSDDPYSAYTQPYYHASLYNNSSNNLWYPTSRAAWQNSDTSSSHSPGINYGNHVLWRESDGTIKARDKSGTHSNYTFPIKFAGPLIMCSGSQSPHYTKLQSVWNTGNTYDGVSAFHGRNRWYK